VKTFAMDKHSSLFTQNLDEKRGKKRFKIWAQNGFAVDEEDQWHHHQVDEVEHEVEEEAVLQQQQQQVCNLKTPKRFIRIAFRERA
jgi:hypothetical protein